MRKMILKKTSGKPVEGHALGIVVGITVLVLLLASGANAQTPVSSCGTISSAGEYVLTSDVTNTSVGSCISITSNNVVFDGAGFTITGGGSGNGVYAYSASGLTNVTVKNLNVTKWSYGIYFQNVNNGKIENNTAISNTYGFNLYNSDHNNLTNNTARSNTYAGVFLYSGSYNNLSNNNASSNTYYGLLLSSASNNILASNTANSNTYYYGFYLTSSAGNNLTDNTVNSNPYGFYLGSSNGNNLTNNTVNNSPQYGMYLSYSQANNINGNVIGNSGTTGIYFNDVNSYNNKVKNNIINGDIYYHLVYENDTIVDGLNLNAPKVSNLGKVSVIKSRNVTLKNLILTGNSGSQGSGLFLYGDNSKSSMSNINSNSNYYGIRISYSSNNTITGSNTSSNTQNGIYFENSNNNSLDGNIAILNPYGLNLYNSDHNNLTNNTARSNTYAGISLSSSGYNNLSNNNASSNTYYGIFLSSASNNILTNNTANSNAYYYGFYLSSSSSNILTNNIAISDPSGFYLASSNGNNLTNNTVSNSPQYGIYLVYSQANNINGNVIGNSGTTGIYFNDVNSYNNRVKNNIINGDIYYHLVYENDTIIDGLNLNAPKVSNLGKVSVINSRNVTLKNLILTGNSGSQGSGLFLYGDNSKSSMSNINSNSNYYGIRIYYSSNNSIKESNTSANTQHGIYLENSNNNSLDGNIAISNLYGLILYNSDHNNLTNNTARSNTYAGISLSSSGYNILTNNRVNSNTYYYGFYLTSSSGNVFTNNTANSNPYGFYLASSNSNNLTNNTANSGQYGFALASSNYNSLTGNTVRLNTNTGIYLSYSSGNNIYNNYFNNTNNYSFSGTGYTNYWNTTITPGINIAGGPYLGGNFWANPGGKGFSQTCLDNNKDGICDSSYTLAGNNTDYLPLTYKPVTSVPSITNLTNVSYAQNYIKWTWTDPTHLNFSKVMVYLDGRFKTNVTKGKQNYNATSLIANTQHTISTHTVDINGKINLTWVNSTARTAPDTIPPGSITNLTNSSYAASSINWTWTNPKDSDFSKVIVYLDGRWKANVSKTLRYYNATGLLANTSHTISTRTVDTNGNINQTWVNNTALTAPDFTPPAGITNLTNATYASNYIKWTWTDPKDPDFSKVIVYIDGILKPSVSKGKQYYNATGLLPNTSHTISTRTIDSSGNINQTWINHTAWTARDSVPPAGVTGLKNTTYVQTSIKWTWTDPTDADFTGVIVYIDGIFKTSVPKGVKYYTIGNLTANTQYAIGTHTIDTSGNINMTWVNHTARTRP